MRDLGKLEQPSYIMMVASVDEAGTVAARVQAVLAKAIPRVAAITLLPVVS